ncbi:hypothetical protein ED860_20020 [Acinetobacter baumannii]|nr:hypothetical protein ED860_20020 [Acinetobacter baumannii]
MRLDKAIFKYSLHRSMLSYRTVHRSCSDDVAVHRSMLRRTSCTSIECSDVRSCTSIDAQTYVAVPCTKS